MLRIGNAQAFWGDSPSAPARLVQQQPDLDYLTLDYLAEVSLSIMAIQREKDPQLGYARDFLDVIRTLIPFWAKGFPFKLVTNAGGLNPIGCAQACQKILHEAKCSRTIGVVSGDDVLPLLKKDPSLPSFRNLDNKSPLTEISNKIVTANAYLGAQPIVDALRSSADIVITGRVADPSLTVGPCAYHYNWSSEDYDRLAGATIAGHVIECGTQVTGGMSTQWLNVPDPFNMGYPVVEMEDDGSFIVTKPLHTGGIVSIETVKEQLLYEIGDPAAYLSPDVTVSFLNLQLRETGRDRIKIEGAKGRASPNTYKVSATYRDGYKAEGTLAIFGPDAYKKAQLCGEMILHRVSQSGFDIEQSHIECFGSGAIVPQVLDHSKYPESLECFLRISVADKRQEALECFSREIAGLVTSGPQGVTGYTSGRPHVRPVFGYWPCLIERSLIKPKVEVIS